MLGVWKTCVAAVVLALIVGHLHVVLADEISNSGVIKKYDFENPAQLTQWHGTNADSHLNLDSQIFFSGKSSLRICANSAYCDWLPSPPPAAQQITHIRVSAVIRTENINASTRMVILHHRAVLQNDRLLVVSQSVKNAQPGGNGSEVLISPANDWTKIEWSVEAPVTGGTFRLQFLGVPNNGTVWLDDLVFSEVVVGRKLEFDFGQSTSVYTSNQTQVLLKIPDCEKVASGEVTIQDEYRKIIRKISIPGGTAELPIQLSGPGYYSIKAGIKYADGTVASSASSAALIGVLLPESERRQSKIGVSSEIFNMGEECPLIGATNGNWDWRFSCTRPFENATLDVDGKPVIPKREWSNQSLRAPEKYPLQIIQTTHKSMPAWLKPKNAVVHRQYPPTDWMLYEKLVEEFARNTQPFPEYYCVMNEPDAMWEGAPEDIVRYHEINSRVIKAMHPETKILGPCMYGVRIPQFKKLVELGLLQYLDGIVMHDYADTPENRFVQNLIDLKTYLKSIGKEHMPVYITEFGWQTNPIPGYAPTDELTQARYLSRSIILGSAFDFDALIYFVLSDLEVGGEGWGLLTLTSEGKYLPKPSFSAFSNVAHWLATKKGTGRWVKMSPNVNLVIFQTTARGTVVAVWTTAENESIRIPGRVKIANDMMGRNLTPPESGLYELSPSPIFLEYEGDDLVCLAEDAPVLVGQGAVLKLPGNYKDCIVPTPLNQRAEGLEIPVTTTVGQYHLFGRVDKTWHCMPVEVTESLKIHSVETIYPAQSKSPTLRIKAQNNLDKPLEATAAVYVAGKKIGVSSATAMPPGLSVEFTIATAVEANMVTRNGYICVEGAVGAKTFKAKQKIDLTYLRCPTISSSRIGKADRNGLHEKINWDNIPEIDFTAWGAFATESGNVVDVEHLDEKDCSAKMKVVCDEAGIYLKIQVRDDQHRQSQIVPEMWLDDSIQVAFDIDADKPWGENAGVGGYKEHWITGYCVALHEKLGTKLWRGTSQSRLGGEVHANVTREGNFTNYVLEFSWNSLGLAAKPAAGTAIGFALLVNDKDNKGQRHGLRLFDGIAKPKPESYGRLWF